MNALPQAIEVPLTRGHVAIVDASDAWVLRWKWHATGRAGRLYASRHVPRDDDVPGHRLLHRLLLDAPPGLDVDHVDGDTLNNRRGNLRVVAHVRNQRNIGLRAEATESGVMGVHRNRSGGWTAYIRDGAGVIYLGRYTTLEAAAVARAREEVRRWGFEPRREQELARWLALDIKPEDFRTRTLSTGVRGIRHLAKANRWTASIKRNGEERYLGCFKTRDEAVAARLSAEATLKSGDAA